jgi:hypothetical protein
VRKALNNYRENLAMKAHLSLKVMVVVMYDIEIKSAVSFYLKEFPWDRFESAV